MLETIREHWLASVLVAVWLGALGSGLWEVAVKPVLRKLSTILFALLSLGASRARDNVYRQAAMDHHELPSLYILLTILTFLCGTMVAVETEFYAAVAGVGISIPKTCQRQDGGVDRDCVRQHFTRRVSAIVPYVVLVTIVTSVILSYRFLAINRTSLAITYFHQCRRACASLMTHAEMQEIEQRFALLENKAGYTALIAQFNEVATRNGIPLPKSYV